MAWAGELEFDGRLSGDTAVDGNSTFGLPTCARPAIALRALILYWIAVMGLCDFSALCKRLGCVNHFGHAQREH